jgi:hypothetical protein
VVQSLAAKVGPVQDANLETVVVLVGRPDREFHSSRKLIVVEGRRVQIVLRLELAVVVVVDRCSAVVLGQAWRDKENEKKKVGGAKHDTKKRKKRDGEKKKKEKKKEEVVQKSLSFFCHERGRYAPLDTVPLPWPCTAAVEIIKNPDFFPSVSCFSKKSCRQ